jgi:hypothetical protein
MLEAFQDALATLCADAGARSRYVEILQGLPEEARAMMPPRDQIERYARSLLSKRAGEVMRVVPLTLRVCPSLQKKYRAHASRHPARPIDTVLSPGSAEALRVLEPLRRGMADEVAYAGDLFAYEVLGTCSRIDGELRTMTSRFAVHRIVESMRRGEVVMDPPLGAHRYEFEKERVRWRPA